MKRSRNNAAHIEDARDGHGQGGRAAISWILPVAGVLILFGVHMYTVARYGVNIAFSDDYNEILRNLVQVLDADSFAEALRQLLHGVGYSKPLTARLIALLQLSLLDEINFHTLVLTGNAFLLGVCLVLAASTWRINRALAIAAACFVCQPQWWEAIYQATLSNSVAPCLAFSLSSLYCIERREPRWTWAALIFAVLAQLSFGNGFLVYPVLLMVAVLRREYRLAGIVFAQMLVTTGLYSLGNTVTAEDRPVVALTEKVKLITLWLPEFYGSALGYLFSSGYDRKPPGETVAFIVGLLMILFFLFLVATKYYRRNLLLFAILTFCMLTGVLAASLRFNVEAPGASRYQIQSALCLAVVFFILVDLYAERLNRQVVTVLIILLPLTFTLCSYRSNLAMVVNHKNRLILELVSWRKTGVGLTIWSEREKAGLLLQECMSRGIYRIPSWEKMEADYKKM